MKKFLPIILVAIAAAVGGLYLLGSTQPGKEGFSGSLTDALSLGKAMKCTWEDGGTSGTMYIKGKEKLYAEIVTAGEIGYMISADNCLYSWESESQGVKLCFTPAEGEEDLDFTQMAKEAEVSLEDDIEYNCEDTVISDSKFTPPTNVEFITFPSAE